MGTNQTGHDAGARTPVWASTTEVPAYPPLSEDTFADVCIIGAGIAGLSVAYHLAREGRSVILIDDGPLGGGETGRTTAHLSNAIDDRYTVIERVHGSQGARLAAESHTAAISRIEQIVTEEAISCDFVRVDGYLYLSPSDGPDLLDEELEAAHRAGLDEVERLPKAPLVRFDTGPCLRFPRQGQFHPLKYLRGLAKAIVRNGGRIHTGMHATTITGGSTARIATDTGVTITADAIVVATNTPINDLVAIHTKQAPYRTYVIGVRVAKQSVEQGLFWDTQDPYHYVRLQSLDEQWDLLIVGGEDHKTGQADDMDDRWDRLTSWTQSRLSINGVVSYRWSGQVMETVDGLAFIGRNPLDASNVYIATGDSGMGMTHGTIAGMLLADLIQGRPNKWATLYDPSRISMRAASDFAQENLNVATQYTEWLTPGEVKSVEEIAPGSGAVLRRGLTKSAVYRDEQGGLHERSAVCPHLSCIVGWNAGEQTWDCPCHGSRFDKLGAVINGPAISDLAMVESEQRPAAESYTSKAGKMPRRPSDHHIVQRGGAMEITRENQFGTQTGASTNPLQRTGSPSTEGKMDRAAAVAGEKLEAAADMIREKAPQEGTLGNTATAVAERLEGMGSYLQNQGLSGAMEDLEGLIRRYPIQSLLLGVGLGYLLSRIKER